jgi:hypothetical protein
MVRVGWKPRTWVEAIGLAIGFPLLVASALLAAVNPASRAFPTPFFDGLELSRAASDHFAEAAPYHPAQRATVDLAGWQLYLRSATPEPESSGFALPTVSGAQSVAPRGARKSWPVLPSTAILPSLIAYRPHAPPA